ncbi:MAG: c-type cytochrome [Longimicrobiales bacterium]
MSSPTRVLRGSKWVLLLGTLVLNFSACVALDDVMASIFGRSMRDQSSFDPYENQQQNALMPPEGTVPFAAGNYPAGHFDVGLGQMEGALDVPALFTQLDMVNSPEVVDGLVNPVPATPESLARGEELYVRTCVVCHGPDGAGTTGYIFEVHPAMAAYPLQGERAVALSDGYLYGIIRVGRGLMPPYGHQITHYDRWHVVNYVRQLQSGN